MKEKTETFNQGKKIFLLYSDVRHPWLIHFYTDFWCR